MINNVLPARAGELARAYAISRETRAVSFTSALASIALDRVFDALIVFALMFGAMLAPGFPAGATIAPAGPREDLVSALLNLGYHRPAADKAVDRALQDGPDLGFEPALRAALKVLSR